MLPAEVIERIKEKTKKIEEYSRIPLQPELPQLIDLIDIYKESQKQPPAGPLVIELA